MGGSENPLLTSALDLAARGFRVFPLKANDWRPALEKWQELATTDAAVIEKVWSKAPYNIGVCGGQGLLLLDVDMKKGKDGVAAAKALGIDLSGFVVGTPTGGKHVYFHGPDVSNSAGRLGDGLDIRSAGGYVVGPGSTLLEGAKFGQPGGVYTVEQDEPIRDAPAALVHRLANPVDRQSAVVIPFVIPDSPDAVGRSIDYLRSAPLAHEGGGGDDTTFRVAARLKDFGVGQEMAVDLLAEHWNDRCSPPWDIEDLKTKVANAYEYGTLPLGIDHPSVDFAGVKIVQPEDLHPAAPSIWFRHGTAIDANRSWLFYGMLPSVGVGVMVAVSQAGKTFLMIEAARCLATGKPFFKETPDEIGGALFVFAGTEGSGLALRLAALQEDAPLPISATMVGNLAEKGALTKLLADLQAEAARIKATFGVPVRLIIIETMAASGLLNDENDNAEASRAMANLAQISHAMGAFVMTSHHPSKNGKESRGASAIPSNADYVMEIGRNGRGAVREVELVKARDAEQRKLGTFTLLPVELGADPRGRPITSMTVSMGEVGAGGRNAPFTEELIQAVKWAGAESGDEDGMASIEAVTAVFTDTKPGPKDRATVNRCLKVAMDWCEQIGRIVVAPRDGTTYLGLKEIVDVD